MTDDFYIPPVEKPVGKKEAIKGYFILIGLGITFLISYLLGYGILLYLVERPLDVIIIFLFSYGVQQLYYKYLKKGGY